MIFHDVLMKQELSFFILTYLFLSCDLQRKSGLAWRAHCLV
jgi:hypothetical protein